MSGQSTGVATVQDYIPKVQSKDPSNSNQLTADDIRQGSQDLVEQELRALEPRRKVTGHCEDQLMGLALSGGGIRSATFSLGVMQALAKNGILEKMDYLSTVSGGGYIGSSLTWFLKSMKGAGVGSDDFPYGSEQPAEGVQPDADSDQTRLLRYLRQHGKYLSPGNGITLLSGVAIVLRAMLLNLLVWLPVVVLVMVFLLGVSMQLAPLFAGFWPESIWDPLPDWASLGDAKDFLFRNFLRLAEFLALLFVIAAIYYSIRTAGARRKSSSRRYHHRRLFEILAAIVLAVIASLLAVGSVPVVVHLLEAHAAPASPAVGPVAVATGLASGALAFFKAGQKYVAKVPLPLVVSLGAALLIYGIFLMSYSVADLIHQSGAETPTGSAFYEQPFWQIIGGLILFAAVLGWFVNLNYVSIHRFYRDRLMEAFMPNPENALDNRTGAATDADPFRMSGGYDPAGPSGPYHIVNTNLVLVNSKVRRHRIRGGDNFILSPLYCGSNATGWRRTEQFMEDRMTLATAMAISGAAANPNTGVGGVGLTRNPLVSILMAMMNLRLGYWATNPDRENPRRKRPNHFHPGAYEIGGLIRVGGLREDRPFIQLSDGGHFENLAFYELIRRKLRLIIVCDGGADPDFGFGDLQTTLRRIEADFGARVTFDDDNRPGLLIPYKKAPYPKDSYRAAQGHIVGDIVYADGSAGKLVLLKTTMVPGLRTVVKAYKGANPDFPDQSTADQFFDEEQFEAYRELGYHIASTMIGAVQLGQLIANLEKTKGT